MAVGYCIVPIGAFPPNDKVNRNELTTCLEWSMLPNKAAFEVLKVQHGEILHRYSPSESLERAEKLQNLKFK